MTRICRTILLPLLTLLCWIQPVSAQRDSMEFRIHFRSGSMEVEADYAGNSRRLAALRDYLRALSSDSTVYVAGLSLSGSASLEGSLAFNTSLAAGRLSAVELAVSGLCSTFRGGISRRSSADPLFPAGRTFWR